MLWMGSSSGGTDTATLIVAIIGSAGIGGLIGQIFTGIRKLMSGVAIREGRRKDDIVAARNAADLRAATASARADAAERNVRVLLMDRARLAGMVLRADPDAVIPPEPKLEDTLTKEQLDQLRREQHE